MAGKFLRGALIELMPTQPIPLPNIIIFQFNPESITHAWTPAKADSDKADSHKANFDPLAVTGSPGETFDFTLAMDSNDMIADGSPVAEGIATVSGIYTRIAALEMLLYPTADVTGGLLGTVSAALGGGAPAADSAVPANHLPTVLFVWGPGRIVPVVVTALSFTETMYDPVLLNPIHAEAKITLRVLTPEELNYVKGPLSDIANNAYKYSQGLREALALANLANAAESAIGMLPV